MKLSKSFKNGSGSNYYSAQDLFLIQFVILHVSQFKLTFHPYLISFQISVCDEYSLPLDFIKKRPSSFDPGLAECLPDNWPSPSSEHVSKKK